MPVLRREQFQGIAQGLHMSRAGGAETGATFDSHSGRAPSSGLAVSLAGSGETVPTAELSSSHLQDYAHRYDASLSRPGVHMGVWVPGKDDEEHGNTWLDNTQVFNDKERGRTEMMAQNERSAYDLDSGDQVDNMMRLTPKKLVDAGVRPSGVIGEATGRGIANNIRSAQGRPTLEADEATQSSRRRP